jgi:hypothetical protein
MLVLDNVRRCADRLTIDREQDVAGLDPGIASGRIGSDFKRSQTSGPPGPQNAVLDGVNPRLRNDIRKAERDQDDSHRDEGDRSQRGSSPAV